MSTLTQTLQKMRERTAEAGLQEQVRRAKVFAEFAATDYYVELKKDLRSRAMHTGLQASGAEDVLLANGERKAYLELLDRFEKLEQFVIEVLNPNL